jgi:esterase/lipase superfamily enzyme
MTSVTGWMDAMVDDARRGREPGAELDIVFLVHGYNTDPIEALKRQRLVERELLKRECPCMVVGFDWPTGGSAAAYLYDRDQAGQAALALMTGAIFPFALYSRPDCPIQVHVLAHSMGGYVIREAFRGADKARLAAIPGSWRIGQMVLFAADVASDSFAAGNLDMEPVFGHCSRLTNYFSGYDEALAVSTVKNLDISSRVGRVGMPLLKPTDAKAVDVDCGPRYLVAKEHPFQVIDGMQSHSWYLEDTVWYDDLACTLKGAWDRNVLPTRAPSPSGIQDDFVLKAQ